MHPGVQPVQIPRLARADIIIQLQRLILGQHPHRFDAGIDTVGQREVDDPVFAAIRHRRFGNMAGQGIQPAALSTGQQHSHTFLFAIHKAYLFPFLPDFPAAPAGRPEDFLFLRWKYSTDNGGSDSSID